MKSYSREPARFPFPFGRVSFQWTFVTDVNGIRLSEVEILCMFTTDTKSHWMEGKSVCRVRKSEDIPFASTIKTIHWASCSLLRSSGVMESQNHLLQTIFARESDGPKFAITFRVELRKQKPVANRREREVKLQRKSSRKPLLISNRAFCRSYSSSRFRSVSLSLLLTVPIAKYHQLPRTCGCDRKVIQILDHGSQFRQNWLGNATMESVRAFCSWSILFSIFLRDCGDLWRTHD